MSPLLPSHTSTQHREPRTLTHQHRDLRPFLTYNARAFSGAPTERSMNPEETKPDITRGRAYMAAVIMVGHMMKHLYNSGFSKLVPPSDQGGVEPQLLPVRLARVGAGPLVVAGNHARRLPRRPLHGQDRHVPGPDHGVHRLFAARRRIREQLLDTAGRNAADRRRARHVPPICDRGVVPTVPRPTGVRRIPPRHGRNDRRGARPAGGRGSPGLPDVARHAQAQLLPRHPHRVHHLDRPALPPPHEGAGGIASRVFRLDGRAPPQPDAYAPRSRRPPSVESARTPSRASSPSTSRRRWSSATRTSRSCSPGHR